MRLVIEELVQQTLLPRMENPSIRVLVEHSAQENKTAVTVTYGGGRFDPRDTDNDLSLVTLKSASEEFHYRYEPEYEQANRVEIRVKIK